ncbi:MAG: acylphosphatase [Anaerolineales bacterium]|nr:acylphosphatase [Anaerolineales bacterium]
MTDRQPDAHSQEESRVHIWVTGRVQGVGFRAYVIHNAVQLGVRAWARNVGYDRVEVAAEGPRPRLERFAEAVAIGPRASQVDACSVDWETPTGRFDNPDFSTGT